MFVAQLVEQLTLNQWVVGSNPTEHTSNQCLTLYLVNLTMLKVTTNSMAKLSYILRHTQGDSSDFQRIVLRVFHCGLYCYITLDVPPVRAIDFDSYCGGAEIRMCSYYPERKRVNALLARYYTDSVYYLQTLQWYCNQENYRKLQKTTEKCNKLPRSCCNFVFL